MGDRDAGLLFFVFLTGEREFLVSELPQESVFLLLTLVLLAIDFLSPFLAELSSFNDDKTINFSVLDGENDRDDDLLERLCR